jgi:hypothetical protein
VCRRNLSPLGNLSFSEEMIVTCIVEERTGGGSILFDETLGGAGGIDTRIPSLARVGYRVMLPSVRQNNSNRPTLYNPNRQRSGPFSFFCNDFISSFGGRTWPAVRSGFYVRCSGYGWCCFSLTDDGRLDDSIPSFSISLSVGIHHPTDANVPTLSVATFIAQHTTGV